MTSSSNCFFLVSMVVSLLFFLGSTSTLGSTKDIDFICNDSIISNKTFCQQTLKAYPPAVSATNMVKLVKATVDLVMIQAEKTTSFVAGLENEPTFKKHFKKCNEAYTRIVMNLRSARGEIDDEDSQTASYDIMVSYDQTAFVRNEIGNNTDNASKKLMEMTFVMKNFIDIAVGAVNAYGPGPGA